ncbi:MAG: hypothetical protein VYA34_07715 [Myxococcota bacterium]|nr:hypothetical protein [Myxococcota bacterium]
MPARKTTPFFLNNNTLCTPHFLEPLISVLERDPTCSPIGPTLLDPQDKTIQHVGVGITPFGNPIHLFESFPANHPIVRQPKKNPAVITGAALLIRRNTFQDYGGFFEDYQNGFEYLALYAKMRRRGLSLSLESKSTMFH